MERLTLSFGIIGAAVVVVAMALMMGSVSLKAYAQQERYVSPFNGFAVTLPNGWVIEDIAQNTVNPGTGLLQSLEDFEQIAEICLAQDAIPTYGGRVECPQTSEEASVNSGADFQLKRFSDLQSRPEIQSNVLAYGKQITAQDILIMDLKLRETLVENVYPDVADYIRFEIQNQQPINLIFTDETGTKQTMPAILAETALIIGQPESTISSEVTSKQFGTYTVTPDGETGYSLVTARWPAATTPATGPTPGPIMQILRSFEVIK